MNSFVYNLKGSTIPYADESDALRFAYLVSDTVDALGSAWALFREERSARTADLARRVALLEKWMLPFYKDDPGEVRRNLEYMRHLISYPIAHTARDRRLQKATEDLFEGMFTAFHDVHLGKEDRGRVATLCDLLDEEVFGAGYVDPQQPEADDDDSVSNLLSYTLDPEQAGEGAVFCLPAVFAATGAGTAWRPCYDTEPGDTGMRVLLLRIPSLHACKPDGLRQLRQDFRPAAGTFCRELDAWTAAVCNGSGAGAPPQALRTAADALQVALEKHPLLREVEGSLEVWAGVLSIADMWTGLRELGAIPDESWQRLQALISRAGRRHPTLMTQGSGVPPGSNLLPEEAARMFKKSLFID
ncbi:MAG: hypothetical protein EOO12_03510 [Chitinophagaceae bacterium]|nr:MAG: hypothetical protein EOO12_03510 [Chitinophagaceae bacterium]